MLLLLLLSMPHDLAVGIAVPRYLDYNGTGAPPSTLSIVVPQKQVLLNITGTQWDPVKGVKHSGITFTAA